eukprot:1145780-Pelagomonas_calceolata.AAC.2
MDSHEFCAVCGATQEFAGEQGSDVLLYGDGFRAAKLSFTMDVRKLDEKEQDREGCLGEHSWLFTMWCQFWNETSSLFSVHSSARHSWLCVQRDIRGGSVRAHK